VLVELWRIYSLDRLSMNGANLNLFFPIQRKDTNDEKHSKTYAEKKEIPEILGLSQKAWSNITKKMLLKRHSLSKTSST
jgi:hypothetical protein